MRTDDTWFRFAKRSERKMKQARKNFYNEQNGRETKTYSATHKAYSGTKLQAKKGGRTDADHLTDDTDEGMVGGTGAEGYRPAGPV